MSMADRIAVMADGPDRSRWPRRSSCTERPANLLRRRLHRLEHAVGRHGRPARSFVSDVLGELPSPSTTRPAGPGAPRAPARGVRLVPAGHGVRPPAPSRTPSSTAACSTIAVAVDGVDRPFLVVGCPASRVVERGAPSSSRGTRRAPSSCATSARDAARCWPTPRRCRSGGTVATSGRCPDALGGTASADLVIVGGGLTGLWAAVRALDEQPGRSVMVLESAHVAAGASGRNGGFVSDSLTPRPRPRVGDVAVRDRRAAAAGPRERRRDRARSCAPTGSTLDFACAARRCGDPSPRGGGAARRARAGRASRRGVLPPAGTQAQADVHSPALPRRAAQRRRAAAWWTRRALRRAARRGARARAPAARVAPRSSVSSGDGPAVRCRTEPARSVPARWSSRPTPSARCCAVCVPTCCRCGTTSLATEPLTHAQLDSIGWSGRPGAHRRRQPVPLLPAHRGRPDPVGRLRRRSTTSATARDAGREQRDGIAPAAGPTSSATFPQLADVRMTHRWAGMIDTTSRFTPVFGTAMGGAVAYAVGYTGLGVGRVPLRRERRARPAGAARDRAHGASRWCAAPRARPARARCDGRPSRLPARRWPARTATDGVVPLLRIMDRFGVGFNS